MSPERTLWESLWQFVAAKVKPYLGLPLVPPDPVAKPVVTLFLLNPPIHPDTGVPQVAQYQAVVTLVPPTADQIAGSATNSAVVSQELTLTVAGADQPPVSLTNTDTIYTLPTPVDAGVEVRASVKFVDATGAKSANPGVGSATSPTGTGLVPPDPSAPTVTFNPMP